ncbi:hypothetical protein [Armatimonas rosea]|uniref:Uncharacterized protein n=1 Tax=Armatimonas rosea TaxID=685828 RepID=A0A7W9SM81_ARMRO|nr:hypothetical protein [Armatimonas rosea]MBB6049205.1 hypothetical protein [Armatimonas rosea]
MFQAQAVAPEIRVVARTLAKEAGVEEALRLVEGLPDKDALELLIAGSQVHLNRTSTILLLLCLILSPLAMLALILFQVLHLLVPQMIVTTIVLITILPCLLAVILTQRSLRPRAARNGEEAIARYAAQVQQIDTVEILLALSQQDTASEQTRLACWKALSSLLPRIPDEQARALSFESRSYLFTLVSGHNPSFPSLSSNEKIHVMIVLAAHKDTTTKEFIADQLVRPALKAAAQSILEDWET